MDGRQGWIEHKATGAWAVKFQPGQIGWLEAELRHGGTAFIAVRRIQKSNRSPRNASRVPAFDELWLLPGWVADTLASEGLEALWERTAAGGARATGTLPAVSPGFPCNSPAVLGRWYGGPAAWDWPAVRRLLLARWR